MLFRSVLLAVFSMAIILSSLHEVQSRGALIFEDNFDGGLSKWNLVDRGDGFGNNELQYYRPQNARTENGNLIIDSKLEWYNNRRYTSAKLTSKQNFKYGYFEIRAKLPKGRGTWPAIWLLANKNPLSWPRDGEIDVMEHVGFEPGIIHGTIHCQKYNHIIHTQKSATKPVNDPFDTFHVYGLEWSSNSIKVSIDGVQYFQYNKEDNSYESWPFDNEFYIILNNAIGGDWGGVKGVDDSIFPTKFTIDYVRVYELDGSPVDPVDPTGNKITLKSKQNEKYVCADNFGESALIANRDVADLWETFELIRNDDGTVSLKALVNGKVVCADDYGNSPLIANREAIDDWEKFYLIENGDGTVSFKAKVNGKFVCAEFNADGYLIANRDAVDTWESFYMAYV